MPEPRWVSAPPDWSPDQPNPFTPDGSYGDTWSCFRLTDDDDECIRNGCRASGLYVVSLGRRCERVGRRLGDFLRYENAHGRTVIVGGLPEQVLEQATATVSDPAALRFDDPRWMVHSTALSAWAAIQSCGELRCFASLRRGDERSVGELLLNDPPDYAEYVALGELENNGAEFVQACRQAAKMLSGPDVAYTPGVRLYFDAHRIIADGLGVRDGLHTLKVRDRLPLEPYLVAAIAAEDLAPPDGIAQWTTTLFRDRANEAFTHRMPNQA